MSKIIKKQKDSIDIEHKKAELEVSNSPVVSKRTVDAKGRAESILKSAETEANKIIKKAEARASEVETIRERSEKDGFEKGKEEGYATITEQATRLQNLKSEFYKNAESDIISLSMSIAEKVIGRMITEHSEVVADVARQALEHALGDRIVIKVNPEDYSVITSEDIKLKDELDRAKRLIIKEDESVSKGGCIVETEVGTIDAQLETQLAAIKKALGL